MQELEEKRDSLAMELLSELKVQARRLYVALVASIITAAVVIAGIVGGFIWYLNQYEFESSIEQTGIYTLIDSEGNVISADLTADQIKEIMEIVNNGKNADDAQAD